MIRIDEIYNNTFWPWINENVKQTRVFFCDPPGDTRPESLFNYGRDDVHELYYIFFHDQEPIHLDIHKDLFHEVVLRNQDIGFGFNWYNQKFTDVHDPEDVVRIAKPGDIRFRNTHAFVHSEWNSESVEQACEMFNWQDYYYFFHGWAALDWYRGYDKTFLKPRKNLKHTFLFPNNIIGGRRKHRIELFVELEKRGLIEGNLVSLPAECPHEGRSAQDLVNDYGLNHRIRSQLPLKIDDFYNNYANTSHELNMWEHASTSLIHVIGETAFYGRKNHLTEKTFKPICMGQPFVMASCRGSLEYLRKYGFETFHTVWDESYDYAHDGERCSKIADLLADLNSRDLRELDKKCQPIVEHNLNHFYGGEFERILWEELMTMLENMRRDFSV